MSWGKKHTWIRLSSFTKGCRDMPWSLHCIKTWDGTICESESWPSNLSGCWAWTSILQNPDKCLQMVSTDICCILLKPSGWTKTAENLRDHIISKCKQYGEQWPDSMHDTHVNIFPDHETAWEPSATLLLGRLCCKHTESLENRSQCSVFPDCSAELPYIRPRASLVLPTLGTDKVRVQRPSHFDSNRVWP